MPIDTAIRRSGQATRQRILQAAILRFAQHSYESTTLRDIAADVGVDVALVHRAVGSKEDLFSSAIDPALDDSFRQATEAQDLAAAIAERAFKPRIDAQMMIVDPLDILVQSLSSPRAKPIVRELFQRRLLQPLSERLGAEGATRAAMALSCLTGLAILRDVLGVHALQDDGRGAVRQLLEDVLKLCLEPAEKASDQEASQAALTQSP